MGERMSRHLVIASLQRALSIKRPGAGLIHHSDRGSQYCALEYTSILQRHFHEPERELLRQCPHGKFLGYPEEQTGSPLPIWNQTSGDKGHYGIHRDFLQQAKKAGQAGVLMSRCLWKMVLWKATGGMNTFVSTIDDRPHNFNISTLDGMMQTSCESELSCTINIGQFWKNFNFTWLIF